MIDLARKVEEEMTWKVELEDEEDGNNLVGVTEAFERATRKERSERMRFAFQLANGMDVLELAGYESGVATRQALEKETAAKKRIDIEMRTTELTVRGLKRKAMRKETSEEKAKKSRMAKRAMVDILWKSGAVKERAEAAKRMEMPKAKPGPKKNKITSNKVRLSKNRDSQVASSRLAMMWASQWDKQQKPIHAIEPHSRGLKRKLFKPDGGVEKARRMETVCDEVNKRDQIDEIDTGLNKVRLGIAVLGCMPKYGGRAANMLKREAKFGPDRAGKVRISFAPKYEAAGGAGGGEEREYTQIWERSTLVARRCLGKGRALDKLVLDSALWHVLCSEEEKAGVPMEVEGHGAKDGGDEKEVLEDGDIEMFKIPCSSKYSSGGDLRSQNTQNVQSLVQIHQIHNMNTKYLKYLKISSPDPCSLTGVVKHIYEKKVVCNPSLWAEASQSGLIRGH